MRVRSLLITIALALSSSVAAAQTGTFQGTVSRDSTGHPIAGATISLPALGLTTRSNVFGDFLLAGVPAGAHLVAVSAPGFAVQTDSIHLVAAKPTLRDYVLAAQASAPGSAPQQLKPVVTTDSAPHYISPALRGFEDRRAKGFGQFIAEKDVRKWDNDPVEMMLRSRLSGVNMIVDVKHGSAVYAASTRNVSESSHGVLMRGAPSTYPKACYVTIYIDGVKDYDYSMTEDAGVQPPDLSHMNVNQYAAVEYYQGGAATPVEYNATSTGCGTLLFWTRER